MPHVILSSPFDNHELRLDDARADAVASEVLRVTPNILLQLLNRFFRNSPQDLPVVGPELMIEIEGRAGEGLYEVFGGNVLKAVGDDVPLDFHMGDQLRHWLDQSRPTTP